MVHSLFVVFTTRSVPYPWLLTRFVTRVTRRVLHVEQELLILPEHLSLTLIDMLLNVIYSNWYNWWFLFVLGELFCNVGYSHCKGYIWCCPDGYVCTGSSTCISIGYVDIWLCIFCYTFITTFYFNCSKGHITERSSCIIVTIISHFNFLFKKSSLIIIILGLHFLAQVFTTFKSLYIL